MIGRALPLGLAAALSCNLLNGVEEYEFFPAPDAGGGAPIGGQGGTSTTSGGAGGTGGDQGGGAGAGGTAGAGGDAGAGGTGPTFEVPCDGPLCAPGEVCCAEVVGANNDQIICADPGTCVVPAFEITCDGPEDCAPGDVCCGQWAGPPWVGMSCATNCSNYPAGHRVMCGGSGGPSSTLCPPTSPTCLPSNPLPGYHYCSI